MCEAFASMLDALRGEFSDLARAQDSARVAFRLLVAAALGGLLGWDRERHGKAAGLRTHMLVAMGAALFVMVPQLAGMAVADLSRVIQGVVQGIGFLGAGAIIKYEAERDVTGLTTAAGVFMTAAIGIACGLGRLSTAVIATVLAWVVLSLLQRALDFRQRRG
jgi:putative Mg2+ transporter-C (MgtC) family protein